MGYAGPKASNIFQTLKAARGAGKVELPLIKNMGNPLKKTKVKGGQGVLDANKDGYLTGSDFEQLGNSPVKEQTPLYNKYCYATKVGKKKHTGLLQKKGCKKKYR